MDVRVIEETLLAGVRGVTPTQLIRIDWIGGLSAGAVMLLLHSWLSDLYRVPATLVLSLAGVNIAYGMGSLSLAARASKGQVPALRIGQPGVARYRPTAF